MALTTGKAFLIGCYIFVGIYLTFIFPWKNFHTPLNTTDCQFSKKSNHFVLNANWLAIALGIAAISLISPWYVLLSLLIGFSLQKKIFIGQKYLGIHYFIGLIFTSFLPWWLHNSKNRLELTLTQIGIYLGITTVTFLLISFASTWQNHSRNSLMEKLIDVSFAILLLFFYSISVSISLAVSDFSQWHHWGAYIGPAELIFNGAYPLYDIPMQYGLGPSLLVASGCWWGCWNSLFWVVSIANILFAFVLAKIAINIYEPRNWLERLLVLISILALCIFWFSNPISLQAPNAFPSGNGLRFLPGLMMLYLLLQLNNFFLKDPNKPCESQFKIVTAFLLWIFSFLWSPEAGIHTTCLICPYFFWRGITKIKGDGQFRRGLISAFKLFVILISGIFTLCFFYYLILGVWPNISIYLTYIVNPINPTPINPNGPIWIIILICYLSWSWVYMDLRNQLIGKVYLQRISSWWLVSLLCFANFSYCLGRSSDGNLTGMLPYFLLLILLVNRWSSIDYNKTISSIILASIIGWSAIPAHFNNYQNAFKSKTTIFQNPQAFYKAFNREFIDSRQFIKIENPSETIKLNEVRNVINFIHTEFKESVETFDRYALIDVNENYSPWNALYGPANFGDIPSHLRKIYLRNVMLRLKKPGWILYDKDYLQMRTLLQDYDSVYDRDRTIEYDHYVAVRYVPK